MKENVNDPKLVESVCTGGDPERKKPCVEGMVGMYINHHGALEPARELCGRLETPDRGTCHETVGRAPRCSTLRARSTARRGPPDAVADPL